MVFTGRIWTVVFWVMKEGECFKYWYVIHTVKSMQEFNLGPYSGNFKEKNYSRWLRL